MASESRGALVGSIGFVIVLTHPLVFSKVGTLVTLFVFLVGISKIPTVQPAVRAS